MPGRWFEEFHAGTVMNHASKVAVTQEANLEFCRLTHNTQPLHYDELQAKKAGFPAVLVNGLYTFSLAVGISVPDTTAGTLVANLGYEEVHHPQPVFPGDVLTFQTRVLDARTSSKPGRGVVKLQHIVRNQHGVEVCTFRRIVLVQSHPEPNQ